MDLNHVTLTGVVKRDPVTRFADHGRQQVNFTLTTQQDGSKKSSLAVLARLVRVLAPAAVEVR